MKDYYTRKEAMDLLGLLSTNRLMQLVRKYPDIFVNVNPGTNREKHPWYDKAVLDKFAMTREYIRQEKP